MFGLEHERNSLAVTSLTASSGSWKSPGALATGPKLLLLDEPAAGMNPQETRELTDTIRLVRIRST